MTPNASYERCDHEDANGQFEINWDPADPLVTADRHAFFKFAAEGSYARRVLSYNPHTDLHTI